MKKIYLFCSNGMSTSLMVQKMKKAAAALGFDCEVAAYGIPKAREIGAQADFILLAPQMRFNVKELQAQFPNIPVEAIDMIDYGTMNGEKVIKHIMSVLNVQ